MRQPPNQPASQRPLRARSGSVAWAPLPPVVSWGRLDRVQLCCTRRPLLHCPALPAGSTCSTQLARCFAGLSLPHSRPGPPVVFIPLARYFVALSPGPRPAYTCGTPVARCFTGLSPWLPLLLPTPGPVGLDPRFHVLRISMKCIYGENYLKIFIFWLNTPYIR